MAKPSRLAKRLSRRNKAAQASHANKAAEARYVRGVTKVLQAVHKAYLGFMVPKLKIGRQDADHKEYAGEFDILGVHVIAQIPKAVGPLFDRMAHDVGKSNGEAQKKLVGISPSDVRLSSEVAHARDKNIRLVEDAARDYAADVRELFDSEDVYNLRNEELRDRLIEKMKERGEVNESRAALIARDQTLKLNGAMTRIRQTNAGVTSYVWSTSNDERVRDTHKELDGQQFDWSSPPEPGHPGEDYQCRCVAIPVIDELDNPEPDEEDDAG